MQSVIKSLLDIYTANKCKDLKIMDVKLEVTEINFK